MSVWDLWDFDVQVSIIFFELIFLKDQWAYAVGVRVFTQIVLKAGVTFVILSCNKPGDRWTMSWLS